MSKGPVVDETKCFVCQEKTPTHEVTRETEKFGVCESCARVIRGELAIRETLYRNEIFRMTLGAPLPPRVRVERMKP